MTSGKHIASMVPSASAVQVPGVAPLHVTQGPVQAVWQQTPSTQDNAVSQSVEAAPPRQASPACCFVPQ